MIIWLVLIIVELSVLFLSTYLNNSRDKKILLLLFIIILTLFSAFRDGLGQDYSNYIEKLSYSTGKDINLLSEPFFLIISRFIDKTSFSKIFFFFLSSFITIPLICSFLANKNNEHKYLSLIIFLFFPTLYYNTFNLVRQFFSVAIFLYSIKFIQSKNFIKYALCILIAFTMHISSLILLPCYFFLNRSYSLKLYLFVTIIFIVIASGIDIVMENMLFLQSAYGLYASSNTQMESSTMVIIYNIIFIIMLKEKHKFKTNSYDTIVFNLHFLLTLFSNLAFINFYFYRLSIFFAPAIAVTFPASIAALTKKESITTVICLIFGFGLFASLLIPNLDNTVVCPNKILGISALFD